MELAGLKTYGLILEKEFENLNLALMLSHFGLRVVDTGEPAVRGRPTPRCLGHTHAPATSRLVCKAEAQRLPCLHPHSSPQPASPGSVLGAVEMNGIL